MILDKKEEDNLRKNTDHIAVSSASSFHSIEGADKHSYIVDSIQDYYLCIGYSSALCLVFTVFQASPTKPR